MILRNSLRNFYQNGRRLMAALHRAHGKTLLPCQGAETRAQPAS